MTQRFGHPGFANKPYNGSAGLEDSPANGHVLAFLVALQRHPPPPTFHGRNLLQRMRVMVLAAGKPAAFDPSDLVIGPLPEALPPMPPALPIPGHIPLYPRRVQGEILRDETGRLYEKIGRQIRALHRLASGPHGEILELAPSAQANPRALAPVADQPVTQFAQAPTEQQPPDRNDWQETAGSKKSGALSRPTAARAVPATYRKLFPDPGQGRVLRWGDFKRMLAPQLAHPERLRDAQQLPCYVQIYEAVTPQRLVSLAAVALGDSRRASQLHPLTDVIAGALELTTLLPPPPRVPPHIRREPGLLLPHDRVFHLQPAHDPTTGDVVQEARQPQAAPPSHEPRTSAVGPSPGPAVGCPGPKAAVPEHFLRPWEFRLGREEVLYDMHVTATRSRVLTALLRCLQGRVVGRRALRKWQVLLCGKSLEEQLWAVRPPQGGLSHPLVRAWAQKTLELAGYNPQAMLLEWEIFWRRKGL
jgi:hypothetical protein